MENLTTQYQFTKSLNEKEDKIYELAYKNLQYMMWNGWPDFHMYAMCLAVPMQFFCIQMEEIASQLNSNNVFNYNNPH
jgi:hypothetical protein